MYHLWNIQTVAVGRWWSETCSCYFFELLIFYYFRYFQPKGTFEFFLLLFQIILNQKELFFKKGTNGKVWYIAERLVALSDPFGDNLNSIKDFLVLNIGWRVTKDRSISFERGAWQQRDRCQNFSSGHNFMDNTFDWSKIRKKNMAMSP